MSDYQRYEDLRVGDRHPSSPSPFEVTPALVRQFNRATGETGATLDVPGVSLAGVYTRAAVAALKGPPGGVHAKQRFRFHRAPRIGDKLTTVLQIREKYQKNGRNYVMSSLVTTDASGALVSEGVVTAVWGREE